MAVRTNQMVMQFVVISSFVKREILSKLMFQHQITFQQKLHRIIECCAADSEILFGHCFVERIHIKMPVVGIYKTQYRISLRRFSTFFRRQIVGKFLIDDFEYFIVIHLIEELAIF